MRQPFQRKVTRIHLPVSSLPTSWWPLGIVFQKILSGNFGCLQAIVSNALVHYNGYALGSTVENLADDAGRMVWIHHGSRTKELSPDENVTVDVDWDLDEDERATKLASKLKKTATAAKAKFSGAQEEA